MKLVLATPLYPPEIGGPATDAAALHAALEQRGISAPVCAYSRVRRFPPLLRHVRYGWLLYRLARGANGIVAFDTVSVGLPATLAARARGLPLIVRVPGDYAWEQGVQRFGVRDSFDEFQKKRYGGRVARLQRVQRFVVRSAALVVVPSEYFKAVVLGWGVPPERLTRIYLGVDVSEEAQAPRDVLSGKILFSLGRFVPWKGFALLISLMPDLPDWHLVIAGDGPLRASLAAQAAALRVDARVTFTGALSHAEVLGWMRRADAFALNTSFESFSFQIVEALAAGVPVITTTAGSIPELIDTKIEGVLCAPDDRAAFASAIASVVGEPWLWRARTEAAKRKAAQFSVDASADSFTEEILRVCA